MAFIITIYAFCFANSFTLSDSVAVSDINLLITLAIMFSFDYLTPI
jgi:hypothetical protein